MIADPYDTVFKDGDLTHLMITEKSGRKKIPKHLSYPIYKLLKSFLANYGIYIGGAVHIGDYQVTAVTIDTKFNIANELILRQLYAFTSGVVNIQLSLGTDEDCAYAFDYDLEKFTCVFKKYVYGATVDNVNYKTLADMLAGLKKEYGVK